ncbi:MAG: serine dehydratase subunit alpha family protein, partial [Synergistales bacterium]|nr:serine dehydratase subunit alpha family protein [Synergistales bacterium]
MFTIKEFLRSEVKPALGCTEPGAVALGVARAVEELGGAPVKHIEVVVSDSIYKNGMYVGIPGTNGLKGNDIAAAMASLCGRSEYGLEVLKDCDENTVELSKSMVGAGLVSIVPDLARHGVYVEAKVNTEKDTAVAVIENTHTNITLVTLNGKTIFQAEETKQEDGPTAKKLSIPEEVAGMNFTELVSLAEDMDAEDVDYVMNGVDMNLTIAEYGFSHTVGINLGSTIREMAGDHYDSDDLSSKVKAVAAAASDARMDGAPYPVMSSAGSGNHGITAILPVYVVGEHYGKHREDIARAIAFSHLTTSFIKSRMGRLSPVCGCSVAAGAGAASGIVYLLSKDIKKAISAMEIV